MKPSVSAQTIDAILPQTQCGLCGFKGCMPYAEALANKAAEINLCPPGGVNGLKQLAQLLDRDPAPFIQEMEQKAKPRLLAVVREAECIGCTKCIQACPVDAILGAAKQMHSVITSECTGCELCVAPCPVDCIDILAIPEQQETAIEKKQRADYYRTRYVQREQRMQLITTQTKQAPAQPSSLDKLSYIQAAVQRAKAKR